MRFAKRYKDELLTPEERLAAQAATDADPEGWEAELNALLAEARSQLGRR